MAKDKEIKVPKYVTKRFLADQARLVVSGRIDDILERYAGGESLESIGASLPVGMSAWKLRDIMLTTPELSERYHQVRQHKAHNLMDSALDVAKNARDLGDAQGLRLAVDTYIKVASKIAPREYGDKAQMELTGKDGGPMEITADLTLTAEQAYERLIKGNG